MPEQMLRTGRGGGWSETEQGVDGTEEQQDMYGKAHATPKHDAHKAASAQT
jgi:hypothetical protein